MKKPKEYRLKACGVCEKERKARCDKWEKEKFRGIISTLSLMIVVFAMLPASNANNPLWIKIFFWIFIGMWGSFFLWSFWTHFIKKQFELPEKICDQFEEVGQ